MRKIIFLFALAAVLFAGCSKDSVPWETIEERLKKEYNINNPGLMLESFGTAYDTSYMFFGGRINNKLWVGYYDKETKQPLLDWTDNNVLDIIKPFSIGYGETVTYKLDEFRVQKIYNNSGIFSFILWGYDSSNPGVIISDLYFINNEKIIKIYKEDKYSLQGIYTRFVPWFEGSMAETSTNYICYNTLGEELFRIENNLYPTLAGYVFSENIMPINYEEGIIFETNSIFKTNSIFSRIDINNNVRVWNNPTKPLSSLPNDAKIGDTVIDKLTGYEWKYSVPYTLYDGTKGTVEILLNINTGYFEIL